MASPPHPGSGARHRPLAQDIAQAQESNSTEQTHADAEQCQCDQNKLQTSKGATFIKNSFNLFQCFEWTLNKMI